MKLIRNLTKRYPQSELAKKTKQLSSKTKSKLGWLRPLWLRLRPQGLLPLAKASKIRILYSDRREVQNQAVSLELLQLTHWIANKCSHLQWLISGETLSTTQNPVMTPSRCFRQVMPKQLLQLRQILWDQFANQRVGEAQPIHSLEWLTLEKREEDLLELFPLLAMGTQMSGNSTAQAFLMMVFILKRWESETRASISTEATRTTTVEWTFQTVSQLEAPLLSPKSHTLRYRNQVCLSQKSWDGYLHLVHQIVEALVWSSSITISTKLMKWLLRKSNKRKSKIAIVTIELNL